MSITLFLVMCVCTMYMYTVRVHDIRQDDENIVTEFNLMLYLCVMRAFIWYSSAATASYAAFFVVRFMLYFAFYAFDSMLKFAHLVSARMVYISF